MRADVDSRLRSGAIESCLRMNAGITALTHFSQRYPKVVPVQQSHNASASHGFLSLSLSLSLSRRRFQYLQSTKMCFSRSTFLFFTQVASTPFAFSMQTRSHRLRRAASAPSAAWRIGAAIFFRRKSRRGCRMTPIIYDAYYTPRASNMSSNTRFVKVAMPPCMQWSMYNKALHHHLADERAWAQVSKAFRSAAARGTRTL